jgi:hypothetical protein
MLFGRESIFRRTISLRSYRLVGNTYVSSATDETSVLPVIRLECCGVERSRYIATAIDVPIAVDSNAPNLSASNR